VPPGFAVQRHEVTLYGQCPSCTNSGTTTHHVCC
jgi:Fe2+ or Zn2+ uptake regulation protein